MAADDPYELAVEQYAFWRSRGLGNEQMLAAVGIHLPWRSDATETVQLLARAERERALAVRCAYKRRAA